MKRTRRKTPDWKQEDSKPVARQARSRIDLAYLRLIEANLNEWASAEDNAAYNDL